MSLDPIIAKIVAVVEAQVAAGAHWGSSGEKIAKLAVKRWNSYAKRHPRNKRVRDWERVEDVAKGFEAHFETGDKPWNIPPSEWRRLAETLVPILGEQH